MSVCIIAKFHGPTDTRGARYIASNMNNKVRVSHGFHDTDGRTTPDCYAAAKLAAKLGWSGAWVRGSLNSGQEAFTCLGSLPSEFLAELENGRQLAFIVRQDPTTREFTIYFPKQAVQ